MSATPQSVTKETSRLADKFQELVYLLHQAGIKVSPDQAINIYDLIIALNIENRQPKRLSGYATLISPLVCRNPADQEIFNKAFNQWLHSQGERQNIVDILPGTEKPSDEKNRDKDSPDKYGRLWPVLLLGICILGLVYFLIPASPVDEPVVTELTKGSDVALPPIDEPIVTPKDKPPEQEVETYELDFDRPILEGEKITAINSIGQRILTQSNTSVTVWSWNTSTGSVTKAISKLDSITKPVRLSPDGNLLLALESPGVIQVWLIQSDQFILLYESDFIPGLENPDFVRFSPNSKYIYGAAADAIHYFDISSGKEIFTLSYDQAVISKFTFSFDGALFAAAHPARGVSIWSIPDGKLVWKSPPAKGMRIIKFSQNNEKIIISSMLDKVKVWDIKRNKLEFTLDNTKAVLGASPYNSIIVGNRNNSDLNAFKDDGSLELNGAVWDINTGKMLKQYEEELITPIKFSPNGDSFVELGKKLVRVRETDTGEIKHTSELNDQQPFEQTIIASDNGRFLAKYSELTSIPQPASSIWQTQSAKYTAVIIPILFVLLCAAWVTWRKRLWLQRRTVHGSPDIHQLQVDYDEEGLWHGELLKRGLQQLRRYHYKATRRLDIDESIEATVRHAGYFKAVYANRPQQPSYLLLVDQVHAEDYVRKLVDTWIARIRHEGLQVSVWYFYQDPRVCYHESTDDAFSLQELAAKHENDRLLLVSDSSGLFQPVTGKIVSWISLLQSWDNRAVVTYRAGDRWGLQERGLRDAGFSIVPLDEHGFNSLGEHFAQNGQESDKTPVVLRPVPSGKFPQLLLYDDEQWLYESEQATENLHELNAQLKQYLGPQTYLLLCACAVYPSLDWNLTLYLDQALNLSHGTQEVRHQRLLRMSRLVWFRHGYIPDYLRLYFIRGLDRKQERLIRGALLDLLKQALSQNKSGMTLPIATKESKGAPRWLRDFLSTTPKDDPMHDYIFVSMMRGNRLGVALPQLLNRLFPKQYSRIIKWLWLVAVCVACVVSYIVLTNWEVWFPKDLQQYKAKVELEELWRDESIPQQISKILDKEKVKPDQQKITAKEKVENTRQQITKLLAKAKIDVNEGRLVKPLGKNALDKYKTVLKMDRNNKFAITEVAANNIDAILQQAMQSSQDLANGLSKGLVNKQTMLAKLRSMLASNPNYFGGTITYSPYGLDPDRKLYSAYYFKSTDSNRLDYIQLDDVYDYTTPEYDWYVEPMEKGNRWGEPYWHDAAKTYLVTYSAIFYKQETGTEAKVPNGVVTIDISLRHIKTIIESLDIGSRGSSGNKKTKNDRQKVIKPDVRQPRKKLEEYPLKSLKMVGALYQDGELRALIKTKDGLIYRANKGKLIGQNNGKIILVENTRTVIQESFTNESGNIVNRETTLDVDSSVDDSGEKGPAFFSEPLPESKLSKSDRPPVESNMFDPSIKSILGEWSGVPYRLGGNSKKGIDTSAFVGVVYQKIYDIKLPRTTESLSKSGVQVSRKNLIKGDLILFKTGVSTRHVGVYIGNGKFIHASISKGVITSSLNNAYWKKRYWMSRRIVNITSNNTEDLKKTKNTAEEQLTAKQSTSRELLVAAEKQKLNELWKKDVLPFCRNAISGRYPVDRNASHEMAFIDFTEMFRNSGLIIQFLKENLYINPDNEIIYMKSKATDKLIPISSPAEKMFEHAQSINKMFFPKSSELPHIKFSLKPVHMDATVKRFSLVIDDQRITYSHGPGRSAKLSWPGPDGSIRMRTNFETVNNEQFSEEFGGPWSWFRLLDEAKVKKTKGPGRFIISFENGGNVVRYEMRLSGKGQPFSADSSLSKFRCQARLFE